MIVDEGIVFFEEEQTGDSETVVSDTAVNTKRARYAIIQAVDFTEYDDPNDAQSFSVALLGRLNEDGAYTEAPFDAKSTDGHTKRYDVSAYHDVKAAITFEAMTVGASVQVYGTFTD